MREPPSHIEPGGSLTGAGEPCSLPPDDKLAPVFYIDEYRSPAEVIIFPKPYDVDGLIRLWRDVAMEPYGGDAA